MVIKIENAKHSYASWMVVLRIGVTAAFFFWFYIIWNSTSELDQKLSAISTEYSAIDDLQIEFKNEIQAWKNVLLRSNNKDTLDYNWRIYEDQYQKVTAAAQDVITKNDLRAVKEKLRNFVEDHKANHELYAAGKGILIRSGYNPRLADVSVNGIDRTLSNTLEAADTALQAERNNINEELTAKSRKQIQQSILSLVFLVLLVVWMPKK